jgi:hypothetical protein
MRDGEFDQLSGLYNNDAWALRILDPSYCILQMKLRVQNAGQKASLAWIWNPLQIPSTSPPRAVVADRPHDRRAGGNRATPQIVAVGNPPGRRPDPGAGAILARRARRLRLGARGSAEERAQLRD